MTTKTRTREILHIEICKSSFARNKFNYEEGDIRGKIIMRNITKKDILEEIKYKIEELI